MNAFDFIVTIALGSTLSAVLLNKDIALADGILALFLLIFLQYLITWSSVRSETISKIIKSKPEILLYKGEMKKTVMIEERITEEELKAAARKNGVNELREITAIILETDGTLTVIKAMIYLEVDICFSIHHFIIFSNFLKIFFLTLQWRPGCRKCRRVFALPLLHFLHLK